MVGSCIELKEGDIRKTEERKGPENIIVRKVLAAGSFA